MKDGEVDYSRYTAQMIGSALSTIDREKYPLNHAKLLAAQQALPTPVDPAALEESRNVALRQAMITGEVWLSAEWTWLFNTALPAVSVLGLIWLVRKFAADQLFALSAVDIRDSEAFKSYVAGVFIIVLLGAFAWLPLRMRRVVMRNGQLEVRSHFKRISIALPDIARIRWNDKPAKSGNVQALIELRVDSRLGRRIRFLPRSSPIMRAFAAHVAAVQGRRDVADPALRSAFHVSADDG